MPNINYESLPYPKSKKSLRYHIDDNGEPLFLTQDLVDIAQISVANISVAHLFSNQTLTLYDVHLLLTSSENVSDFAQWFFTEAVHHANRSIAEKVKALSRENRCLAQSVSEYREEITALRQQLNLLQRDLDRMGSASKSVENYIADFRAQGTYYPVASAFFRFKMSRKQILTEQAIWLSESVFHHKVYWTVDNSRNCVTKLFTRDVLRFLVYLSDLHQDPRNLNNSKLQELLTKCNETKNEDIESLSPIVFP